MKSLFVCGISRSGTTLISSMLDAHPDIFMCNELLGDVNLNLHAIYKFLDAIPMHLSLDQIINSASINLLPELERKHLVYIYRTGIDRIELANILSSAVTGQNVNLSSPKLLAIAQKIVHSATHNEKFEFEGWKLSPGKWKEAANLFPDCRYIYVIRDPRAVVFSQSQRFERSVEQITAQWKKCVINLEESLQVMPDKILTVHYEDVVIDPLKSCIEITRFLNIDQNNDMYDLQRGHSKALIYGHNNKAMLEKGITSSRKDLWKLSLDTDTIHKIETDCGDLLSSHGYLQ